MCPVAWTVTLALAEVARRSTIGTWRSLAASVGDQDVNGSRKGDHMADDVLTLKGPNGPQTWTLNPPGGPMCDCGEPAALVTGPRAKRDTFSAYRCAKGVRDDWRNKCSFNQWV